MLSKKRAKTSPVQRRHKRAKRLYRISMWQSWLRFFATDKIEIPREKLQKKASSKKDISKLKVAIAADWLTNMGGAERVVFALHKAFPSAPIYTSVFTPKTMPLFKDADVRTTFLQHLPKKLRSRHQLFPVFRAFAFRRLNLDEYDVVISSASAEAKAVLTPVTTSHICYCHTPTRYYWSHYSQYKRDPGFGILDPIIKLVIPPFVWLMRRADLRAVTGVDHFIANSGEVRQRIKKYYHRPATVIFPPVDTERLKPTKPVQKKDYYLVVGRQIPYKRMDLAIEACNKLGKQLVVVGNGSEHQKLMQLAGPTVTLKTGVDDQAIIRYFQEAKALLWPQVEDFGVTAVEALAAGTPVIAYKAGGALDFIKEGETGVFFDKQTADSLAQAINKFEDMRFHPKELTKYAENFSEARFIKEIQQFVAKHLKA